MSRHNRNANKSNDKINNQQSSNRNNLNNRTEKDVLKSKDKVVTKMTRDGVVLQNLTSGESKKVSRRSSEFALRSRNESLDVDLGASINDFMVDAFPSETNIKPTNQAGSQGYSQVGNTLVSSNDKNDDVAKNRKRKIMRIHRNKAYSQNVKNANVDNVDNSAKQPPSTATAVPLSDKSLLESMPAPKQFTPVSDVDLLENKTTPDVINESAINRNNNRPKSKYRNKRQNPKTLSERRINNVRDLSVRKTIQPLPLLKQNRKQQQRRYPAHKQKNLTDKALDVDTSTSVETAFTDSKEIPYTSPQCPPPKIKPRSIRTGKIKLEDKSKHLRLSGQSLKSKTILTTQNGKAENHASVDNTTDNDTSKPHKQPKISKLEHQIEKTTNKLEKAKDNLPTKRKLHKERIYNEQNCKAKTRLSFEKEVKSQNEHIKGLLPMRPVKLGANIAIANAHRKVFQVEHENVGTKAAHRTELVAESVVRSALRHQKTVPYKKVAKLQRRQTKQSAKLAYKRTLAENPKLKKNPLNRILQKRKIKKKYAKAAHEAKKATQQALKAKSMTSKATSMLLNLIKRNPKVIIITLLLIVLIYIITSLFGMITSGGGSGLGGIFATTYLAEEQEIENASLAYNEWEMNLMFEILGIESNPNHHGYDEYRYNTGDIRHNPFELIAYLTATKHMFTYAEIEVELRSLFDEQYQLVFTPSVETKYREEETGEFDDDGEAITESVPYDWHVLTVTLTARNFTDVIYNRMTAEQRQHFNLLMQTRGQRQMVANPFDIGWIPYLTSEYGYRIHPINDTRDLHRGIDIGMPLGTDIKVGFDGTITFAGVSGGYGNVVVIQADTTNAALNGLEAKYAHMDTITVSNGQSVKMGDVIGTVGSTGNSTGAHLHLELLRNGNYLNPIFFTDLGNYVYSDPLNPSIPQNNNPPRPPMTETVWNNVIEVAESKLGLPYVFGANGPNAYDCSSFVSAVLRESGIKDVGRQTAQGLYNLSSSITGEPQPGDLFFLKGTYSTSNYITHVGIFIGFDVNGRPFGIHAGGSKVQYVYLDTPYYQQHWVGYGRLS